jgi:hypothetical protein
LPDIGRIRATADAMRRHDLTALARILGDALRLFESYVIPDPLVPIWKTEPFLIVKGEPLGVIVRGSRRLAHAATPLGTRSNAWSEFGSKLWRGAAWRGRAGQAFVLGEPGVVDGTTADSLAADRRGPLQDDQAVRTKPLARSRLRILDQGLGPTRARCSRNRPLEQPGTIAGLAPGWAGRPCQSRPMQLTSQGTPIPDVNAPRWVTRWSNRNLCLSSDSCLLE